MLSEKEKHSLMLLPDGKFIRLFWGYIKTKALEFGDSNAFGFPFIKFVLLKCYYQNTECYL
jgi:hypothetical protein